VNLSDIAAMGGRPRWMTLALTIKKAQSEWLEGFARGLFSAATDHGVELVGGDTTRGQEIVVSVQVTGEVATDRMMTRSGACAGDAIYVSGTIGDAALGLARLQLRQDVATRSNQDDFLIKRFTRPDARVEMGREIAAAATAAIDLSDGLYADLDKLLSASGVGGVIEVSDIPLSTQLRAAANSEELLQFALAGGDDYELCFTAPSEAFDSKPEIAGVPVTCIGQVTDSDKLSCTLAGNIYQYHHTGYRHFHEQ